MNLWQAIILGFVQGIAEFLPISSSGHLVIIQNYLQINPPPFYFDIFIHLVSLVAIIIYFYQPLLAIISQKKWQLALNIVIGTLPIFIIGYLSQTQIENLFFSTFIASLGFLITAGFNLVTSDTFVRQKQTRSLTAKKSLIIGLGQVLALVPGISRSGATLFTASQLNLSKRQSFRLSFFLAIPAIIGANVAQLLTINPKDISALAHITLSNYLIGGLVCLIVSLLSLKLLKNVLANAHYHWFGYYCFIIGLISLFASIFVL